MVMPPLKYFWRIWKININDFHSNQGRCEPISVCLCHTDFYVGVFSPDRFQRLMHCTCICLKHNTIAVLLTTEYIVHWHWENNTEIVQKVYFISTCSPYNNIGSVYYYWEIKYSWFLQEPIYISSLVGPRTFWGRIERDIIPIKKFLNHIFLKEF